MTITTVTSRKLLPTTLAVALAGLLMVSGCTKQADEDTNAATETQTEVANTEGLQSSSSDTVALTERSASTVRDTPRRIASTSGNG